ncbi:MAG: flagellar hook-length control protein FliK, partial [Phycisphaerae bacterium]
MGPHQLLADVLRPLDVEIKPTAEAGHDPSPGRFNEYLEEARSVHPDDRPEDSYNADEVRDEDSPEIDEKKTKGDEDPPEDPTVAPETVAGSILVPPAPAHAASDVVSALTVVPRAGVAVEGALPVKAGGESAGDSSASAQGEITTAAGGSEQSRQTAPVAAESVIAARGDATPPAHNPAHTANPNTEAASDEQGETPVSNGREARPDSASQSSRQAGIRPVSDASKRVEPPVANKDAPITPDRIDGVRPAAESEAERDPVIPRESIQQRKVRDSIQDRREGASGERDADAEHRESGPRPDRPDASRGPRLKIQSNHILQSLKTTTLRTGHGDGAAASLARFLVSTPLETSPHAGPGAQGANSLPGVAVGSSADARAAPQANLIGDLLASPAEGNDAIEGVARMLSAARGSGHYQATMQLEPPELGQLRVHVRMHQQAMTLQVQADSQPVARLIESRLADLREALATHGIRIDRADVVVRSPESAGADAQPSYPHGPAGRGDAGDFGAQADSGYSSDGGAARTPDDQDSQHGFASGNETDHAERQSGSDTH